MTNRTQTPTLEDALPEIERRLDAQSSEPVLWRPFSSGARKAKTVTLDAEMFARLNATGALANPATSKRNAYLVLNMRDPETSEVYPMPVSRAIVALIMYQAGHRIAKGWRVVFKDGNPCNLRCSNLRVESAVKQRNSIKAFWIMSKLLKAQAEAANDNARECGQRDAA